MDLKELENGVNPETHWYYQSKKLPLLRAAERALAAGQPLTVVDVGAGSGFFALELEKAYGPRLAKIYLVDTGYSAQELAATQGQKVQKVHAIPERIEHGLFVLMDVLEHVENDVQLLRQVRAACVGDGNRFFITVPAFQSLWSGHDVFLGHYRRYRIPLLRAALRQAGLGPGRCYYLYGSLFLPIWAVRQLGNLRRQAASNMRPFGPLLNRVLLALTSLEMRIAPANRLFAVTCVAEGRI